MNRITLEASKTYATAENAEKAVEKMYGPSNLRYTVMRNEAGRYFVIFLGTEGLKYGVHFHGHCIVG